MNVITIRGKQGSGKSTLLKKICKGFCVAYVSKFDGINCIKDVMKPELDFIVFEDQKIKKSDLKKIMSIERVTFRPPYHRHALSMKIPNIIITNNLI